MNMKTMNLAIFENLLRVASNILIEAVANYSRHCSNETRDKLSQLTRLVQDCHDAVCKESVQ